MNRVNVKSLYEFDSIGDMFFFIAKNTREGKTVYFENEDIEVSTESEAIVHFKLTMYFSVKNCPEIYEAYSRYLNANK